jgi:antitoxin VapB
LKWPVTGIYYDVYHIAIEEFNMDRTAKIFTNGRSQAVRLPADYRFEEKEVFIRKDEETGDIILSRKPSTWGGFFVALNNANIPTDFLDKQERLQQTEDRDPFDGLE